MTVNIGAHQTPQYGRKELMKKSFFCFFLAFALIISALSGCESEITEESSLPDYSSVPETPVEDFEFEANEDGEIALVHYFGGDETVKIPAYFEGKPVTVINMYAFINNAKLKTLILPETAKTVNGTSMHTNCQSVETIVLNGGLEKIAAAAFRGCSSLKSINLPQGLKSFGDEVFYGCTSLKNVNLLPICFENGETSFAETGLESIVIPEGVTEIPWQMFAKSTLKSVQLPSTLKTVSSFAFYECPLESLSLPDGIEVIENSAFYGAKFSEVTLPKSVTDFREDSFGGNTNMEKLTVLGSAPENFYQMGPVINTPVKFFEIHYNESAEGFSFPRWNGFPTRIIGSDKSPLTSGDYEYTEDGNGVTVTAYLADEGEVVIPEAINGKSVVAVGGHAFRNKSLRSVTMPDSIESIGNMAFQNCDNLTDIKWSSGLKTIGDEAFGSCNSLKSIKLPEGVESIGSNAFVLCSELESVSLPESIKFVGGGAFSNNRKLKEGVLRAGVEYGTGVYSYSFVETAVIEEGVTVIPDYTFDDSNITELTLPSTIKSIGSSAFRNANFDILTLPDGLEELGYMSFGGIYYLKEVVIPASVKEIHDYTFSNCRQLETVTFLGSAPNVTFLEDDPDNPYDDDMRADLDYAVCYYSGASGFDTDYWQGLGATAIEE